MLSGLDFKATGWLSCRLLFVQLFAAKALSYCKHDMDALLWLNVETLKIVTNPLLGRLVRCSTLGPVLKHFMHSLGMGIFKHTRCSFGDEGWIGLPEDITEDCHDYKHFEELATSPKQTSTILSVAILTTSYIVTLKEVFIP